jgi:peroxiredoxin
MLIALFLFSCERKSVFEVSGAIEGAEGQVLFLEKNALDGKITLDSVVLPLTGDFLMKAPAPSDPEFYQLRLGKNLIPFAVDSTERIIISALADSMSNYQVTGSGSSIRIKELLSLVNLTNSSVRREKESFEASQTISQDSLYVVITDIIKDYKRQIKPVIVADPKSPVAYFALFQKLIYGITPFSLSDKDDLKYYAAVATAWNIYHKESIRSKQLYNLVTYGQESIRKENLNKFIEENSVGYIDINLPDKNGKILSLTSSDGKVILLDFCSYLHRTPYDIIELRDLYSKNREKGFEIYQVSFDKDISYWKNTVEKLPWICVNDSSFSTAVTYNVTQLPTNYLIDKEGNIVGRDLTPDVIRKYLGNMLVHDNVNQFTTK